MGSHRNEGEHAGRTAAPLDAAQSDRLRRQLDAWRRQLISVDRRQRHLYFKLTRTASLELIDPAPADLAILLSRPTRLFTPVPVLLIPVELTRGSRDRPFRVHRNQEDPVLNRRSGSR